ncbi:hypothetical protein ACS0TY_010641 [Phlomoides rotata]
MECTVYIAIAHTLTEQKHWFISENRRIVAMDYSSSEEETCLFAMKLVTASVLPAALKTAIDLDLLELIKKAGPASLVSRPNLPPKFRQPTRRPPSLLWSKFTLLWVNLCMTGVLKDL